MKKKSESIKIKKLKDLGKHCHGIVAQPEASVEKPHFTREEILRWSNPLCRVVGFIPLIQGAVQTNSHLEEHNASDSRMKRAASTV